MSHADPITTDVARDRLVAAGLDPDRPLDALTAHRSAWGRDEDLARSLIHLLAESDDEGAGAALSALVDETRQRELRREIKRALYRLTQRGRWQAEKPAPPPTAALLGAAENEPEAWLSPIDPTGTRLLWMSKRVPEGVASVSAITTEDYGLREIHAGQTTRKALRQAQRDLIARSGIPLVEAPWPHVHDLIRDAWEATKDRARLGDVPGTLRLLAPRPPERGPHPVDAYLDRTALAADENALADSAALGEPELAAWLLPFEWIEPAMQTIREATKSLVVTSPVHERERLEGAFARAVDELFEDPARRARFANRLEETAYLLAKRGAVGPARSLLAAALAARTERPIAEIPLLAELARRSLGFALEASEKREQEEARSSLVVTPAQAIAEERRRQQSRRR
jgi:hypothetical protein